MNDAYAEMKELQQQISAIHARIAEHYKQMSLRNQEFYWQNLEQLIEAEKAKASDLRQQLLNTSHRFINWQNKTQ